VVFLCLAALRSAAGRSRARSWLEGECHRCGTTAFAKGVLAEVDGSQSIAEVKQALLALLG